MELLEMRLTEFEKIKKTRGLSSEQRDQFNKTADFVCRNLADYFELEPEDLKKKTKKREILFPRQIAHYQLAEENKKIFKKEYWSLIARLFGMKVSTVIHSYSMIDGWKNLPTPEGREIREVLGLFKNHWISYRK